MLSQALAGQEAWQYATFWCWAGAGLFMVLLLLESAYLLFASVGVGKLLMEPKARHSGPQLRRYPLVSCIVTCYAEGEAVAETIASLVEQDYAGEVQVLAVIDGAALNQPTLEAAHRCSLRFRSRRGREVSVLARPGRGGRASSLNAGLAVATGEIVMALDGDTAYHGCMIALAVRHFEDGNVVALAGTLRVRNAGRSLLTRLQALDYLIYRRFVRSGLGALNTVNNIPGAHGIFRADFLRRVGGWDTGSAEDVDLCWRIKKYFGRNPRLRIAADPHVMSFTDVPDSWVGFLRQRLRWEGDPLYLWMRKHAGSLRPGLMGWRNFLFLAWYGVIYQLLMPLLLLVATALLLLCAPPPLGGAVLLLGYLFLLLCFALVVLADLLWISDRPREDVRLATWLPLYPVFFLLIRLWSAAAVLHSLLLRSHLDSSMAPWWVLRKGKF